MRPTWVSRGWRFRPGQHPPHTFFRLGAFIDGVYAIAATLLVLELRLPEEIEPGHLAEALRHVGGQYGAYAIGFVQMVVGWLQTRRIETFLKGVDHYATLLLLVSLGSFSLTPFTTQVLARSFGNERDLATAVRLMAAQLTAALVAWAVLLIYVGRAGLFREDVDSEGLTLYRRNSLLVWLVPVAGYAVSFRSAEVGLALVLSLYLLGLLPLEAHAPAAERR